MIFVHTKRAAPPREHGAHGGEPHVMADHLDRRLVAADDPLPADALWIDLFEPTREEDRSVEDLLGIAIPTRQDMLDLEPSDLLYVENGARYMTARVLCQSDTAAPKLTPIAFILTERALVTVRYDEPRAFVNFASRAVKPGGCAPQPEAVLDGLVEAIIDRAAEVLQRVGDTIEDISRGVFEADQPGGDATGYRRVIRSLGKSGDLISNVRESMVSMERMLLFLSANMARPARQSGFKAEWRTTVRDVQSIEEHASFLSNKAQFILDGTLGLVSIQQNNIIKLFSVMSVILMPPTLIASIYGMNFKHMPELEWVWGYPMALGLMLVAAVVPFLLFRAKRWL